MLKQYVCMYVGLSQRQPSSLAWRRMRNRERMHSQNCCNEQFCNVQDVLESLAHVINFDV